MPNEEFGTPDAKDATSQHEKTVQEAGEYAASLDQSVKDDILNRPLGSVKVSPEQRRQEYELARDNPAHLAQLLIDNKATVEEAIRWATEMEKRRQS